MYKVIGGDEKEYGPVSTDEVRQWIAEGRLSGQSLIQGEGDTEWKALTVFPEFAEALRTQAEMFPSAGGSVPPELPRPTQFTGIPENEIQIGSCLSRSGQLISANFGLLVMATALVWLLSVVSQLTPFIGGILYLLIEGVLYGGLYLVYLKVIRGQTTSVSEVFSGFGPGMSQLMLAGFVTSFLSWLGLFFCIIPWVYLVVAWVFAVPLVADKKLEFWAAMELSRRTVTRIWAPMALLMLLAFLPVIIFYLYSQVKIFSVAYPGFQEMMGTGTPDMKQFMELLTEVARVSVPMAMMNKLILLFNLPFAVGALMYAYEDLFGSDKRQS